jgi:hypothetical protein
VIRLARLSFTTQLLTILPILVFPNCRESSSTGAYG